MKNLFSFYVRALTSIPVQAGKADFRLVNGVANEILGKVVCCTTDEVLVQLWADDTENPGGSRYDLLVIKYVTEEVSVRIPTPLVDKETLNTLVGKARILNLNRVRSAIGDFDSDEEKEARREESQAPNLELAEDNHLLWREFVGQYLSDEGFVHLSPQLQKILSEKVGKVRAKMLVTA